MVGKIYGGELAGIGIGHYLDDVTGGHGNESVHLQNRQEGLIKSLRIQ